MSTLRTNVLSNLTNTFSIDVEDLASSPNLADITDPLKGAGLIGFDSSLSYAAGTVGASLKEVSSNNIIRTIESFGPVNTPANTKTTMQSAINFCAANNILLVAASTEYTVDLSVSSITIPSNFRCDLGGATIKRATGNTTPQDMWINVDTVGGNTNIDIRNVKFDGQRTADSLDRGTVAHRFSGLRLKNCSNVYVNNVRVDNTVNGELQAEGIRTAIIFEGCTDTVAEGLFCDNNNGTGVSVWDGRVVIRGVWAKNNDGSGFGSRNCDFSEFYSIHNENSGYSGISINAQFVYADGLFSNGSPLGYAGVNIGHTSAESNASGSKINNIQVRNCLGWGIYVNSANNVDGVNWYINDSVTRGLHVENCLKLRVKNFRSRGAAVNDILLNGASSAWVDVDCQGSQSSSVQTVGTGYLEISESSIIDSPCQVGSGAIGGIIANAGTTIVFKGKIQNSARYGAVSSGAGALVILHGAVVTGSSVAATLTSSGGVLQSERTRYHATDSMSGTLTIAAAASTATVTNGNAFSAEKVVFTPTNTEARLGAVPLVTSVTPGVSFAVSIGSATTNARTYSYVLN